PCPARFCGTESALITARTPWRSWRSSPSGRCSGPPTFFPYTTLFRSLGFHKQMDNRIKLLEEILSFRMQGVEFDNGKDRISSKRDRKSGSAGMPRPISYAVFCLRKNKRRLSHHQR